jgi:putative ABC transport system permease protein
MAHGFWRIIHSTRDGITQMKFNWLKGLFRLRAGTLVWASAGVCLAVTLLALLGVFIVQSASTMTARAVSGISPDWQVQLVGTTEIARVSDAIGNTVKATLISKVDYADVSSLSSTLDGTTQTTGAGKAVGLEVDYARNNPRQIRLLSGSLNGVLLAQQTASNLHAGPGDTVTIARLGQPAIDFKVDGVVEVSSADQFFQIVSSSPQTARNAPPDNIIFLPASQWETAFGSQLDTMPQTSQRQLHVSFDHSVLPGDPTQAFIVATEMANNLAAKLAGEGVTANNLAARLDGVRQDSLFAKVLFLFLGTPGAIVAILLTMLIVLTGSDRRKRDIALLQMRGATSMQILSLSGMEALVVGVIGAVAGVCLAFALSPVFVSGGIHAAEWYWFLIAGLSGILASLAVFLIPSWVALRSTALQNTVQPRTLSATAPTWQIFGFDIILLLLAWFVFWQISATGYQVVAAPEGVATATVDYKAYAAPAFFWTGSALLFMRLFSLFMRHGRTVLEKILAPIASVFSKTVSASLSRESGRMTKGAVLVALAISFAVSTAIFNTTYENQANVDATLTNGADVTITGTSANPASPLLDTISKQKGVVRAEPMQHRYAYVGNDLQDLYGIDPATIASATAMSNAYFGNDDAIASLASLKNTPNGVLVSDETVSDFQLKEGDAINLRLQTASDHLYHIVSFKFIGIAREFPTAPKDSFLIANAAYVAAQTGNAASEVILIKSSIAPPELAAQLKPVVQSKPGLVISDISEAVHRIGSSLVAVDLRSLTGLELAFALPLAAGAVGLVFALGLAERRRSFAILQAIGATPRQLGAFVWSEALIIYVAGTTAGLVIGWVLAWMLTKLMTQVFDPPPDAMIVPWGYVTILCLAGLMGVCAAVLFQLRKPVQSISAAMRTV